MVDASIIVYETKCVVADSDLRDVVRDRYAEAPRRVTGGGSNADVLAVEDVSGAGSCCGPAPAEADAGSSCCSSGSCAPETVDVDASFGAGLYSTDERSELSAEALAASLGCGNPLAVAELRAGERVLDLGSSGGIACSFRWP